MAKTNNAIAITFLVLSVFFFFVSARGRFMRDLYETSLPGEGAVSHENLFMWASAFCVLAATVASETGNGKKTGISAGMSVTIVVLSLILLMYTSYNKIGWVPGSMAIIIAILANVQLLKDQ